MTVFIDIAVAGVVVNDGKMLIMRRSKSKSHYAGSWDFPCERVKDEGSLSGNVVRGVMEEAGLAVEVVRRGSPVTLEDGDWRFVVVPLLCDAGSRDVRMDREHDDFRWVSLDELDGFDMIHNTRDILNALGLMRKG
ncbi:MAG: NUDIX domain-containing protein [Candidatus Aenigmarchaeota archaeon]|nr:NUDIX domain-containing protein [Candidatus Aenigmarchaeota archaeon]